MTDQTAALDAYKAAYKALDAAEAAKGKGDPNA